jgi:uncharacterized membrane protein YfcA
MPRVWFDVIFGLGIGFYDGFFGPGTGTFWTMAFVLGLGFNLTRATGYTKVVNFASNLSSLAFFLFSGHIYFAAGLAMGVGQVLGAKLGSGMVLTRGTKFIRPSFVAVVLSLALKLLYDAYRRPVKTAGQAVVRNCLPSGRGPEPWRLEFAASAGSGAQHAGNASLTV